MKRMFSASSKSGKRLPLELSPAILKFLVFVVLLIEIIVLVFQPSIAQNPEFHDFADKRTLLGISNFSNVVSNLGFIIVGLAALYKLLISKTLCLIKGLRTGYKIFFVGICLVTAGSAYYHLHPDNTTLVWDRAPMTIAFMALLSISFAEFMSPKIGRRLLWPLLLLGVGSVYYWSRTERTGHGDLRLYVIVQLTPICVLPVLLIAGKRTFDTHWGYWLALGSYILAKIFELNDDLIYHWTFEVLSGHALKHVAVAIGLYGLLKYFEKRRIVMTG